MTKQPSNKRACIFTFMGETMCCELEKGESVNYFNIIKGLNGKNPDAPISEAYRIFEELKELEDEHETTA